MGGINQLKTGDLCWPNWFMATITRFYGEYIELLNGVNINQQTYCGWLRNPNPQLVDGKAPVRIPWFPMLGIPIATLPGAGFRWPIHSVFFHGHSRMGWRGYGHPMPLGHDHPPRAQLVRWDLEHMDRKSPWLKQRDLRFPPSPQTMDGPRPIEIIYQTSKIVFSIAMLNCLRLTTNFRQQNVSSYQKISKKRGCIVLKRNISWSSYQLGKAQKICSDPRNYTTWCPEDR
jgi:hypothetical protein